MLNSFSAFIAKIKSLQNIADVYDVFEFECTDDLRDTIYSFADPTSPEPFRSAMYNLGFKTF